MNNLGYNKNFLGEEYRVDLPKINSSNLRMALNNGEIFDFMHFSLVMHKIFKSAIYVASNIDKEFLKNIKRKEYWHFDKRIGEENQVGNDIYKNNEWDRGHLARRKDICWGSLDEATLANYDSFCWANISLQHKQFNQGIWSKLEEFIYNNLADTSKGKRLSIFTGPINCEGSIKYCGKDKPLTCNTIIPVGFWKTIFFIDSSGALKSKSFVIKQDKYFKRGMMNEFNMFLTCQVSLADIMSISGLEFKDTLLKSDDNITRATPICKENDLTL